MPIAGSSPARSAILETTLRGGLLFSYASGPRAGVDSGMAGLAQGNEIVPRVGSSFSQRLFVVDLFGGGQPAFLLTQLAQRGAPGCTCPGCASRRGHTYGVQPGHGRTSRSVWLPLWRAPRRTCHPSAWGIRGTNRGAWVLLAPFPPPFGHKKSHRRGGPTMASLDSLGNFNDTLRSYSHSIHRTLMFPGGREIPAAPSHAGGRCAGWSSPYPRRSSPMA